MTSVPWYGIKRKIPTRLEALRARLAWASKPSAIISAAGFWRNPRGDADVKRLRFIRSAQAAGFTLNEIKELLDLDASDDRARARELARARVAAIDEKIADLRDARDALAALATACANKRAGPCPILKAFDPK